MFWPISIRWCKKPGRGFRSTRCPLCPATGTQIRQLLQNLISNALKYRDRTRVPEIAVSVLPEADFPADVVAAHRRHVRIAVQDNGIGFDEKYSQQIFEPFQRLHGPDEYEGTGIGLAICRKIVQRHGGSISATSRAGVALLRFHTAAGRR